MTFWAYNIAILGPTQSEVAEYLNSCGETGVVTPQENGATVFSSDNCSMKDGIEQLGKLISQKFQRPALAMHNYDDAILWLQLFVNGEIADEYNSCPTYFGDGPGLPQWPQGGNSELLCETWGVDLTLAPLVEGILRFNILVDDEDLDFETDLQQFLQSDVVGNENDSDGKSAQSSGSSASSANTFFSHAIQALPPHSRDRFLASFNEACIEAGVGNLPSRPSYGVQLDCERERHAALAAALGLPLCVTSLCGTEELDVIPEGAVFLEGTFLPDEETEWLLLCDSIAQHRREPN